MKKSLFYTVFILLLSFGLKAQTQALFDYRVYPTEKDSAIIDLYLNFIGPSLSTKTERDSLFYGEVDLMILVKQNEAIVQYAKKVLKSPLQLDGTLYDFFDLQRFKLASGEYEIEIEFNDHNITGSTPANLKTPITIEQYLPDSISISKPLTLGSFSQAAQITPLTRSGFNLFPYLSDYFPKEISKLLFYTEIYNSKSVFAADSGKFAVKYSLTDVKKGKVVANLQSIQRKKAEDIVPLLMNFDITGVPSGVYALNVEALNVKGEVVASTKHVFQRNNPLGFDATMTLDEMILNSPFLGSIKDEATITEYINCLRPIGNAAERRYIDNQEKRQNALDEKKRFFYTFWANRDAQSPDEAWQIYREQVRIVNENFSSYAKKGYETDRGRVYLQYGPPNTRAERPNEAGNYPYEVWHYYKIDRYNNKRFVFYSTNLSDNDYALLHSDMYGEPKNPQWESFLRQRNDPSYNNNRNSPGSDFGNRSNDFFNNPR